MSRDLWVRNWTNASGLMRHKTRSPRPLACSQGSQPHARFSHALPKQWQRPPKKPTPARDPHRLTAAQDGITAPHSPGWAQQPFDVLCGAEPAFPIARHFLGALSTLVLPLHPGAAAAGIQNGTRLRVSREQRCFLCSFSTSC